MEFTVCEEMQKLRDKLDKNEPPPPTGSGF